MLALLAVACGLSAAIGYFGTRPVYGSTTTVRMLPPPGTAPLEERAAALEEARSKLSAELKDVRRQADEVTREFGTTALASLYESAQALVVRLEGSEAEARVAAAVGNGGLKQAKVAALGQLLAAARNEASEIGKKHMLLAEVTQKQDELKGRLSDVTRAADATVLEVNSIPRAPVTVAGPVVILHDDRARNALLGAAVPVAALAVFFAVRRWRSLRA